MVRIRIAAILVLIFSLSGSKYQIKTAKDWTQSEKWKKEADSLNNLGLIYKKQGNYNDAFEAYLNALDIYEKHSDSLGIAKCSNRIGSAYYRIGEFDKALSYYLNSLSINEALNNLPGKLNNLINLGNYYGKRHNYSQSIDFFKQASTLASHLNNNRKKMMVMNNLGNIYADNNVGNKYTNYDSAFYFYRYAFNHFQKVQDTISLTSSLRNLGFAHELQSNLDSAIIYYDKCYELNSKLNFQNELAGLSLNIGNVYFKQGKSLEALEKLKTGLIYAQQLSLKNDVQNISKLIADIYLNENDWQNATYYLLTYDEYKDSVYNEVKSQQIIESKTKYETEKKENQIKLQEATIKQKDSERKGYLISLIVALALTIVIVIIYQQRQNTLAQLRISDKSLYDQKVDEILKSQELKSLSVLMEGQESERKRIARELHDRLGSMLSTIKIYFDGFVVGNNKDEAKIQKTLKLLDNAVEEIREISNNLASGVLTKFGLKAALNDLVNTLEASNKIKIETHFQNIDERLSGQLEIALYRIIQEMIGNTLKHAHASKVTLQIIRHQNNSLGLMFEDNGKGFDLNSTKTGMGLKNIEARISPFNGSLYIDSRLEKGTTLTIDIPKVVENYG